MFVVVVSGGAGAGMCVCGAGRAVSTGRCGRECWREGGEARRGGGVNAGDGSNAGLLPHAPETHRRSSSVRQSRASSCQWPSTRCHMPARQRGTSGVVRRAGAGSHAARHGQLRARPTRTTAGATHARVPRHPIHPRTPRAAPRTYPLAEALRDLVLAQHVLVNLLRHRSRAAPPPARAPSPPPPPPLARSLALRGGSRG